MLTLNFFYKGFERREVTMFLVAGNIKHIFLAVLLINLCVLIVNLASQLFFTEEAIQSINLSL